MNFLSSRNSGDGAVQFSEFELFGRATAPVSLAGSLNDNEDDILTTMWAVVSGPGLVTFSDPGSAHTTVTFTEAGTYILRLTADDGLAESYDDITITVMPFWEDSDNDGVNDVWELEHFDTLADTGGTGDRDEDGVSDFVEFLTGSDPNVAGANRLALRAGPSLHGAQPVFRWSVQPGMKLGQHYIALISTDLDRWDPLPPERYTLTTDTVDGMTAVELELTYNYGDAVFITLDKP